MADMDFAYAQRLDTDRQARLTWVCAAYPELLAADAPPEEQLIEIAPFLIDKPQKLYHEAVYTNALQYLTEYYARHNSSLVSDFAYVADSLRRGALKTEHYGRIIGQDLPARLEREAHIRGYWCPWYLNLVEECLKEACSPLVWAVSQARGKKARLEDMRYFSTRADLLNTVSDLRRIGGNFNPTVRNACAHGGVTVLRDRMLLFEDDKGKQECWTDEEFLGHIHGLLDVCNAMVLASMVFVFRNWSQLAHVFHAHALPEHERERLFLPVASTPAIEVRSVEVKNLAHGRQVTIEAVDTALVHEELFYDTLAILRRVQRFYPDTDLVFLGLQGSRHWASWVSVPIPALREWVSGAANLQQFLQMPNVQFMLFPFKGPRWPLGMKIASLRRGLAHGLPRAMAEYRQAIAAQRRPWHILEMQESIGLAKRLQATLIVPEGLTRQAIEPMLVEAIGHIRRKLFRTKEVQGYKRRYRKAMAKRSADYVRLFVFTKEKRAADMWADPTASYFVCRAEWFNESLIEVGLQPVLNLPDRIGDFDITVAWGPLYPA